LVTALALVSSAADKDVKDTTEAAETRAKKLTVKLKEVDYKEETLFNALEDLSNQVNDAGGGSLKFVCATGVSRNQKISYSAKNQTVAEILDGLLKKNGLGYIVLSIRDGKEKNLNGWVRITMGNERGWPAGQEPKDTKKGKDDKKPEEKKPEEKKPEEKKPGA
jgi:hypothetical protein